VGSQETCVRDGEVLWLVDYASRLGGGFGSVLLGEQMPIESVLDTVLLKI
jgi:hypothetical protein